MCKLSTFTRYELSRLDLGSPRFLVQHLMSVEAEAEWDVRFPEYPLCKLGVYTYEECHTQSAWHDWAMEMGKLDADAKKQL